MGYLIVFFGAGLGGSARYGVSLAAARLLGTSFPWGTLAVNVVGSFAMGVIAEYWALKAGLSQPMRLFLTTGILGGFTTFSAFSLDATYLWERGQGTAATVYAAATVAVSIGALFAGLAFARMVLNGGGA